MSKIGKKPVSLPANVEIVGQAPSASSGQAARLTIKGPLGTLECLVHPKISFEKSGDEIIFKINDKSKATRALWGTMRALMANAVTGVTKGFSRELLLEGLGYQAEVKDQKLLCKLGYNHPVHMSIPQNLNAEVKSQKGTYTITISGIDREAVGRFAGQIRKMKPAEPYKGKGFRYVGEIIKRKAVKKLGK